MFLRSGVTFFLLVFSAFTYASKLPTSFDGYVTSIISRDTFDVGTRRVKFDRATIQFSWPEEYAEAGSSIDSMLRVGAAVHIDGTFEKGTNAFVATAIALQPVSAENGKHQEIDGVGLIEEKGRLSLQGQGISGEIWVDGYPLQVTPKTKLLSADGKIYPYDRIGTNVWAVFHAIRRTDGSIQALSITFEPNTVTPDEVKYRDRSEPEIVPPDYSKHTPGKIKFPYRGTPSVPWALDILPDKGVQDYVTKIGDSLVPQYQKDLPAGDPTKINFRFYVVQAPSKWKETLHDASSTAGGVIYIPDDVLGVLDNESQLAALLSNCIAVTLEKQFYLHRTRSKVQNDIAWASTLDFLLGPAALIAGSVDIGNHVEAKRLILRMNEQATRIGLRYMLNSGYDIREAPFAWTVAANDKVDNPLCESDVTPPLAQSVMSDLYFDYASTDYSHLKTNRDAYQQMLAELRTAAPKLPKPKNQAPEAKSN